LRHLGLHLLVLLVGHLLLGLLLGYWHLILHRRHILLDLGLLLDWGAAFLVLGKRTGQLLLLRQQNLDVLLLLGHHLDKENRVRHLVETCLGLLGSVAGALG
jgi:hypothetical protein